MDFVKPLDCLSSYGSTSIVSFKFIVYLDKFLNLCLFLCVCLYVCMCTHVLCCLLQMLISFMIKRGTGTEIAVDVSVAAFASFQRRQQCNGL
jgi:hypothetical protein